MFTSRKCFAAAVALACAGVAQSAQAQGGSGNTLPQIAPVAPKIYDQEGRLVGALLPVQSYGYGRVLLQLGKGEALLNIRPTGLYLVSGSAMTPPNLVDAELYYASGDCSGPAYMRVFRFPNYANVIREAPGMDGFSPRVTIQYAARPFVEIDLVAIKTRGVCSVLSEPIFPALVGVATTETLPPYKLPFVTK